MCRSIVSNCVVSGNNQALKSLQLQTDHSEDLSEGLLVRLFTLTECIGIIESGFLATHFAINY